MKKMKTKMQEDLIDIIQHNMTMTFNEESKKFDINFEYIAWQLMGYIENDCIEHVINKINLKSIRSKSEESFDEDCDIQDIKDSYDEQKVEKEIYMEGYWRGYIESYQDTTGLNLPLP